MFAPIAIPPQIHTVHGLTYRVGPIAQRSGEDDPQQSRRRAEHVVDRTPTGHSGKNDHLDEEA